jgi:thioredoxin 1
VAGGGQHFRGHEARRPGTDHGHGSVAAGRGSAPARGRGHVALPLFRYRIHSNSLMPGPDGRTRFLSQFLQSSRTPRPPKEENMASDLIKHISDATFDADVLKADKPVLVDYWAEWCGPCKMIAPILDEVSATYKDKLQIAKMNVDENQQIPAKFGIRGIPTLMLFKDGQLAATKVGAMSKAQLTAFIDQQLGA